MASSSLRNVVVTGANRGLGFEICRQLIGAATAVTTTDPPYHCIYALCRKASPELTALAAESKVATVSIVEGIDPVQESGGEYESSILAKRLTLDNDGQTDVVPIELLIHNAGAYGPAEEFTDPSQVYSSQSLDNITPERLSYAFQLNSAAPLFITQQLLPHLRAHAAQNNNQDTTTSTKVIIISSLMGSINDNMSGGHYAYRAAKAAVNMIGKSLSADLKDNGIAVGLVHPGFVHTGFGTGPGQEKRPGQRDVGESVQGVLEAIDKVTLETTGRFWHANYGQGVKELPW